MNNWNAIVFYEYILPNNGKEPICWHCLTFTLYTDIYHGVLFTAEFVNCSTQSRFTDKQKNVKVYLPLIIIKNMIHTITLSVQTNNVSRRCSIPLVTQNNMVKTNLSLLMKQWIFFSYNQIDLCCSYLPAINSSILTAFLYNESQVSISFNFYKLPSLS
jgi:hypothetical protein